MQVKLLTTNIEEQERNAAYAMLTCHANTDKLQNEKPEIFIKRAIKLGHESILEHITLTFEVKELSRACLQELARHRHISLSVESTRHTLKRKIDDFEHIFDYLSSLDEDKNKILLIFLGYAWSNPNESADILKYCLPEFWPTNLVLTANVRELRHIIKLRTSPEALQEFQDLAYKLIEAVPEVFKYLLQEINGESKHE